jgi:hypothetical protein
VLAGLFLIIHGLVHVTVWAMPFDPDKGPFDPGRSWLLELLGRGERARPVAAGLAWACAAAFVVAGIAVTADADWGAGLAITAAVLSLVLTAVWFNPWLSFNVLINAAIIAIASGAV